MGSRNSWHIPNKLLNSAQALFRWILLLTEQSQNRLVMSKELDPNPAPEVEEDVDGDGDRQQQAVETQTAAAGAALWEVLIHCSRVEQTKERHYGD